MPVQFFVCFQSFTVTKLFASSLLCWSISYFTSRGYYSVCHFVFNSCRIILRDMSRNKRNEVVKKLFPHHYLFARLQRKHENFFRLVEVLRPYRSHVW